MEVIVKRRVPGTKRFVFMKYKTSSERSFFEYCRRKWPDTIENGRTVSNWLYFNVFDRRTGKKISQWTKNGRFLP